MNAKVLFFLFNFILAGSRFPTSSSIILFSFNEKIASGDTASLRKLIDENTKYIEGSFAKSFREEGLLLAILNKHTPVVELLLEKGNVDAAANNNEAIYLAAEGGNTAIAKLLLARPEVHPGAMGNRALIAATRNGHSEIVRLLLMKPSVKSSDRYYLAAYLASDLDHTDIVKLFIGNGNVNPRDVKMYALDKAASLGNIELVRYMLEFPKYSQDAHLLLMTNNLVQVRTLFEAGLQFDKMTLENALEYARLRGNDDIVEYLESLKEKPKLPEQPLIAMTEQCAICLSDENLLEGYMTACNHQFHAVCLQSWIAKHNTCPMCRSSII